MGTGWWELRILAGEIECSLCATFDQFVYTRYTMTIFHGSWERFEQTDDGTSFNAAVTRRQIDEIVGYSCGLAVDDLTRVFKGRRIDQCFFCTNNRTLHNPNEIRGCVIGS